MGLALALHGAEVVLTDLPDIVSLTSRNIDLNFPSAGGPEILVRPVAVPYVWGMLCVCMCAFTGRLDGGLS